MNRNAAIIFAALAGSCLAQNVPSGWKVIKDSKQMCQIAVPSDWTTDAIMKSMAADPAKKSTVVVHWARQNSFGQTVSTAKQMMKPVKVFEESGTKVWYSYRRTVRSRQHIGMSRNKAKTCVMPTSASKMRLWKIRLRR